MIYRTEADACEILCVIHGKQDRLVPLSGGRATARAIPDSRLLIIDGMGHDIPRGACDCHVHVFDPARLPYLPQRPFTPPPATVDDLGELLRQLHLNHVVIVQPLVLWHE